MNVDDLFKALFVESKIIHYEDGKECDHEWVKESFIKTYCCRCGMDQDKLEQDKIKE